MAKRNRTRWQRGAWWALSALIVVSMLCSLVLFIQPPRPPEPTPTVSPAPEVTAIPTPTPESTAAPTPSPLARAPTATAPALGSNPDFTFAVCGDSRDGDRIFSQILRQVESDQMAFLVHTGDLVNYGSESAFMAFAPLIAALKVPFKPVPGKDRKSVV